MTIPTCRPGEHLRAAALLYPGAWKQFEEFRASRGVDLPEWPEWCYCPLSGAYAIVSGGGDNRVAPAMVGDVGRLGALAAWRMTQGIYRFDPALFARLIETPLSGDLPTEILYHLPEWCVYIETNFQGLAGFFAHLEHDVGTGRSELRLVLDYADPPGLIPFPLHLGDWSLVKAVDRSLAESQRQSIMQGTGMTTSGLSGPEIISGMATALAPMLSLLLYLCCADADYGTRRPTGNPIPIKTRWGGIKMFPASNSTTWDVGVRIGSALRAAYLRMETNQPPEHTDTGRSRPRPHVRVAHWHTYLTGIGRSKRLLRWIPPVPVNVGDLSDLPATIRPVR